MKCLCYKSSKPSLLLFSEPQNDAMLLIEFTREQMIQQLQGSIHFATSNSLRSDLQLHQIQKSVQSFHDFMIDRDYNTDPTPITASAEVLYAFDMVMQGTQSTAVIISGSSSAITMFAFVSAAFLRDILIVNLYVEDHVTDQRKAQAILPMPIH
ncbi:hypothetical protein I4U23_005116 [Adineta vaga]|nr:hypothetical protein I4U23_005116 [Adineta vaga]